MGGMDDIVAEFLAESVENLDQLDQDLVTLEKNPSDREIFAQIFRTIHTIKGTCGFLAFGTLESVTHVGESLLSRLREGSLDLRPEITTDLLALIDAVRAILANIDATGREGDEGYADLIERLKSHGEGTESTAGIPEPGTSTPPSRTKARVRKKSATTSGKGARAKKKASDKKPARKQAEPTPEPTTADEDADELELTSTPTSAETSIRVDVRVLDHLMNLVGELVLSRNQLVQNVAGSTDSRLTSSSQRLDAITGELQEAVMRTRMQPISSIWKKLPRFTSDLSLKFGKQVEIEMEGEETDLDKSVIEAIKGSLLHLVRNAVDHGIEDPDAREKKGKPRSGTLRLRAHHEGGTVVIEVHDDGGGLDRDRILARAVEAGLVTETESESLSRNEIESFIFHPGFSTASKVTNISGRGVGLDVVRTNVERMGGSVELQSEPGESTTFRVKIPLTLAIVSVLLVAADEHRIAIPQASVVELIRLRLRVWELKISTACPCFASAAISCPWSFSITSSAFGRTVRTDPAPTSSCSRATTDNSVSWLTLSRTRRRSSSNPSDDCSLRSRSPALRFSATGRSPLSSTFFGWVSRPGWSPRRAHIRSPPRSAPPSKRARVALDWYAFTARMTSVWQSSLMPWTASRTSRGPPSSEWAISRSSSTATRSCSS